MTVRDDLLKELEHEIQYFSEHTKAQYRNHSADYLDFVKRRDPSLESWKERDMVYAYIDSLKKKRQVSQSHINYVVRGPVGCLFRICGLRLPVKLPPTQPAVYDGDDALSWKEEEVERMIKVARVGDARTQAIMAVASIYAPRVAEIAKITKQGIDYKKMVLTILTVKHNLVRRHLIPEAVQYQICHYGWEPMPESQLRGVLAGVIAKAGIERQPRQSFHAFRHALWGELSYRGLPDQDIYKFTGWIRGGTLGSYVPPLKYDPHNDQKIFANHPFLPYWK